MRASCSPKGGSLDSSHDPISPRGSGRLAATGTRKRSHAPQATPSPGNSSHQQILTPAENRYYHHCMENISNDCGVNQATNNVSIITTAATGNTSAGARLNLMARPYYPNDVYCLQSGTSHHLTRNLEHFDPQSYVPMNGTTTIKVGNSHPMKIMGRGSISRSNIRLPDVLYIPELNDVNAVSVRQLDVMDYEISFGRHGCLVKERLGGEVVGKATLEDDLYKVDYLRIPLDRSCLPDYNTVEAAIRFAG